MFELFVAITVALMSVAAAGFGYRSARIATRLERFLTPNRPDLERIRDLETESAILIRVLEVFGDSERAIQWMRENNPALKNEPPIRAIQQEDGRREVLNILGRIEHGVIS